MDVELLKTVDRQRLVAIQDELDFGDGRPVQVALPITSSSAKRLWNALVGLPGVFRTVLVCVSGCLR